MDFYRCIDDTQISLVDLDEAEAALVARLLERARNGPNWIQYQIFWEREVERVYRLRGMTPVEWRETIPAQVGFDLSCRVAITAGRLRKPDYREELVALIRSQFQTRREFCEATGLSEDMLSHILAGRKNLSLKVLTQALDRIGYKLKFVTRSEETGAPEPVVTASPAPSMPLDEASREAIHSV